MKIMAFIKIYVFTFFLFAICAENILSYELTQKNKELYLECIKLKQEIGNENIQCEKILLENIKKNLNNQAQAEQPKNKQKNEYNEDINKRNINNSDSNPSQVSDNFNFDDYVERIEKFIEGEINHLNKFKVFIGDFKEKSKKYVALNKLRNNSLPKNTLNRGSNEEKEDTQNTKEENKNSNLDNLKIISSLKNKRSNGNSEDTNEYHQAKKQIKFKQTRNNESNRDVGEDNLENDFFKLKEKLKLASESHKEEKTAKSKENENNEKANNLDLDSVQALISKLNNNKIKKKEEAKNTSNSEVNEGSSKDSKLDLLNQLKSLGLNINKGNQEATNILFKKFLNENANKVKNGNGKKNNQNEKDENSNKQANMIKEEPIKNKSLEDFDLNEISESLAKLKNEKRRGSGEVSNTVDIENNSDNGSKNKNKSSIVDISDNLNLDSFKNLMNNSDQKRKKNDNEAISKKENVKGISSSENEDADKLKSKQSDKTENKKDNKKTDFNFSLGEIESQIEMLKNLSIKP